MRELVVAMKLDREDREAVFQNFGLVKKDVKSFFAINSNRRNDQLVVISLTTGDIKRTSYGAVLTEIKRPFIRTSGVKSSAYYRVLKIIKEITSISKTTALASGCVYYEDCLEVAGNCSRGDVGYMGKNEWWGFSCRNCQYK